MAKKVQSKAVRPAKTAGVHRCGGELIWSKIRRLVGHAHMARVCDKCGAILSKSE